MEPIFADATLLFVVDVQERLLPAMHEDARARVLKNLEVLLAAAGVLGVRVVASEQYPKGLGPTVSPIRERLAELGVTPMPKMDFDACGDPAILRVVTDARPRSIVVAGMETHVCVFQTVRELARRGYPTYVLSDAVASRTEDNRAAGLRLCERAGAVVSVTEAVVFDWLRRAGTDAFKQISKLIR
jgi:nicotinamidase-related amidase